MFVNRMWFMDGTVPECHASKAWFPCNRPDQLNTFLDEWGDLDNPDDYMETRL